MRARTVSALATQLHIGKKKTPEAVGLLGLVALGRSTEVTLRSALHSQAAPSWTPPSLRENSNSNPDRLQAVAKELVSLRADVNRVTATRGIRLDANYWRSQAIRSVNEFRDCGEASLRAPPAYGASSVNSAVVISLAYKGRISSMAL